MCVFKEKNWDPREHASLMTVLVTGEEEGKKEALTKAARQPHAYTHSPPALSARVF